MSRARKPWLLLFNCQAMGIANCLTLLSDQISVEYHDPASCKEHGAVLLKRLDSYERVIVSPAVEIQMNAGLGARQQVWRVPAFDFTGYHPDLCFLISRGKNVMGAMGNCHSMIAYASFRCGLNEAQAIKLFCETTYSQLGYFDNWNHARDVLLSRFKRYGFDYDRFVERSRNGPFMYASHHPDIGCLRDIAKMLLAHAGLDATDTGALPHDNLAMGPIFPVYPEIAQTLGVSGSYLFKLPACYRHIDLAEFVGRSFSLYRDSGEIVASHQFEAPLASAVAYVKSLM